MIKISSSIYFIAVSFLSLITANRVIHLNSDNFDAIVDGTRNVFLKFEASWCGPCKRMAPILDQLARFTFPNLDGEIILAAVDADKEREIGDRFDINSFPTIKLFLKGRSHDEAIEFTGERSPKNIEEFIKHHVTMNNQKLPAEVLNAHPPMPLTQILQELSVLSLNTKAKALDTRRHASDLTSAFNTMPYKNCDNDAFDKFSLPEKLTNLKKQKIKSKKPKEKKRKNRHDAGVRTRASVEDSLPSVDAQRAQEIILNSGAKPVILIFFSPNCPHCHEFMPLVKTLAESRSDVTFLRVNGDANIPYRDSFDLRFYPSIIGFYPNTIGKRWELFSTGNSIDNLNAFINKLNRPVK